MVNIRAFSRRVRRRARLGGILFFASAFMMAIDFTTRFPTEGKGELALVWACGMSVGLYYYLRSFELPAKEIIQLAEERNGLLTLSEISTALDVPPATAARALRHLASLGVARASWMDLDRNLFEFPDMVKLPLAAAVETARTQRGRVSLTDLVALGHTPDVAQRTLGVLTGKGVAVADEAATPPTVVVRPIAG